MNRLKILLLAGLVVSSTAHPQSIYRWVDRDGVVHYADQPGAPNAERIEYAGLKGSDAGDAAASAATGDSSVRTSAVREEYQSLAISSPTVDQTFFGTDVDVPVALELDPPLQQGDHFAVFLDGKRVTDNLLEPSTQLSGLVRGTHFVRAAVLSAAGEQRITSAAVSFHVRHPSVARPAVGPALRPPPKARP